jgi:hypothetical protein
MKEKRCKGYCGVACVDGRCPIALYYEDFTLFEKKPPSCEDCFYYKGCEDCCFDGTDMCERKNEKGGAE